MAVPRLRLEGKLLRRRTAVMKLDSTEARRRFARARVARLATVGDATGAGPQPHLVPVTFAVDGERVLTAVDAKPKRSTDLKRLRNIRACPNVSLLVDYYAEDWNALWWVRADGTAQILEKEEEARVAAACLLVGKYDQYPQAPEGPVIEVMVRRWVGWAAV